MTVSRIRWMRATRLLLVAATVAAVSGTLTTAAGASSGDAPEPTVSRYVPLDGTAQDLDRARQWGCAEGETGRSGLRVLFFGTQEEGGEIRQPGTSGATQSARVSADRAVEVAERWADGFASCRDGGAEAALALGVNNKDDGGIEGSDAGAAWADVVDASDRAVGSGAVSVVGGVDAEPSWSQPQWARDWVDAFTQSTGHRLYAVNSADGCPSQGSDGGSCSNGWSVADVHYVAGGAGNSVSAVPQIYRTDGIQARQWASISAWGAANGEGALRFAGAMAQQRACEQRSCDGTDNSPQDAWTQLWEAIDAESDTRQDTLPHATDIRWPS